MMLRRPASRRSNSASEKVRVTFSPLLRTLRRSSLATSFTVSSRRGRFSVVVIPLFIFFVFLRWVLSVLLQGLLGSLHGEQDCDEGNQRGGHEVPAGGQLVVREADEEGGHE